MFTSKIFTSLNEDIKYIRTEVFVKEQGFKEEFDTVDENQAIHIVVYDNDKPAGVCRFYTSDGSEYHIGRVAVMPDYRKDGIGSLLMQLAQKDIENRGGKTIVLSSQCRARAFYEKNGYTAFGDEYLDEFCPHIAMKKVL